MSVGNLNESALHAALKEALAPPGAQFEVPIGPFVVDIFANSLIIEIQTQQLRSAAKKIAALTKDFPLRMVLPIAAERELVKHHADGTTERRKSPKRLGLWHVFHELVFNPRLLETPNFVLELVLIREREHRKHVPGSSWRRRDWLTVGRDLVEIIDNHMLHEPNDLLAFVPGHITEFTTAELAKAARIPRRAAQQMAYCLYHAGVATRVGKRGNAWLYRRQPRSLERGG